MRASVPPSIPFTPCDTVPFGEMKRVHPNSETAERRKSRRERALLLVGQPQPVDREGVEERNEDCGHYRACLTYASDKGWIEFSCAVCPDYHVSNIEVIAASEAIRASMTAARRG